MRRTVNLLSSLLMVAGIALLLYAAWSYRQSRVTTAATPHWSRVEREQARRLASQLQHHQTVAIPRSAAARLGPPGAEPATRIVIPRIGVNAPVVQTMPTNGVWDVADWAVGHLATTPNPGGLGNAAYSAHDDIKGEIFKRLGELKPGDVVRLYTAHAAYNYVVTNQLTVDPSDISVLDPTRNSTVTLISCTPYWVDTQRIIIQGVLKSRAAI